MDGKVGAILGVFPVDDGFEELAGCAFGNSVGNRMDDEATPAQICLEKVGVIEVTGEAGESIEQEAGFGRSRLPTEIRDHLFKSRASDSAGA
ncbi:MAG: hypothetical protein ABSA51_07535 [Anaerolineaceae bacterium]